MSIYSWYENAQTATSAGSTDMIPVYPAGVGPPKILTVPNLLTQAAGIVDTTATTLTITQALHGNRTVTVSSAAPIAVTLPQATGTGTKYKFQMQVVATATSHTIKVANATDVMQGVSWCLTTASANVVGYGTSATSDTISLNGTTLGGVVGDIIEIEDVKTGFFSVRMFSSPTGTTATPFSATV
jgi:hypothetical protein